MKKNRVPQIITGIVGVTALVGVSAGIVAINANRETPIPTSTASAEPFDAAPVDGLLSGATVGEQIATETAARIDAERAAAAQAEADRIAAEQAEAERQAAEQEQAPAPAPQPAPAPAPEPPAPVFQCPPGAVDAGDGASCWWEYCFTIQPIPNPDYPECDGPFRP